MNAASRKYDLAIPELPVQHRQSLHELYDHAPGFIATTTGALHTFEFANASYKRFVGCDDLVGRTVADVMPEIIEQGIITVLDDVYRTGEPFVGSSMQIKLLNPVTGARDLRSIDVVYQPVRGAKGEIVGLFCEGYEVTARNAAQQIIAALQAQMIHVSRVNAMGTMAATLAHELNQPFPPSPTTSPVSGSTGRRSPKRSDASRPCAGSKKHRSAQRRLSNICAHSRAGVNPSAPRSISNRRSKIVCGWCARRLYRISGSWSRCLKG